MTDVSVLEQHALRLAILADDVAKAAAALEAAKQEAAPDFAVARARGTTQQRPVLPGGFEVGLFSLFAGGKAVDVNEDEVMLHVALTDPGEIEDYVSEAALRDKRVVDLIGEHCPEYLARRVTAVHRAALQKELEQNDGCVHDANGELVRVATITQLPPTGRFQYKPDPQAAVRISQALAAGTLTRDGRVVEPAGGDVGE